MLKRNITAFVVAAFVLGACSDSQRDVTGPMATDAFLEDDSNDGVIYDQVEFLGNPLVSEVTIAKANHDAYNRTQPYNTATFGPQSLAFINAFRGGQPVVANTLGAVLYPDMLIVEIVAESSQCRLAVMGARRWLGWPHAFG